MKNVPEFEGLRGFLSTVVVIAHLYPPLVKWVWGSMDIFFCMSGFLIGQLIMKGRQTPGFIREYAWRRITRIWPAYYAVFAICLLYVLMLSRVSSHPFPWPPRLGNALSLVFLQNTEMMLHPGFVDSGRLQDYLPLMGHTWSVALEEQFYLLAPIIFWALSALGQPWVGAAIFACVCCVMGSILRCHGFHWLTLLGRFDGFAVGLFAAVISHQKFITGKTSKSTLPMAWAFLLAGGGIYILLFVSFPVPELEDVLFRKSPITIYGVTAVAVFSGGLLLLINHHTGHATMAVIRWGPLLSLGRMSYSTYLAHIPVIFYSNMAFGAWPPMCVPQKMLIQLLLCFGGAYALYILVERPIMQRRGSAKRTAAAASYI